MRTYKWRIENGKIPRDCAFILVLKVPGSFPWYQSQHSAYTIAPERDKDAFTFFSESFRRLVLGRIRCIFPQFFDLLDGQVVPVAFGKREGVR